MNGDKRNHVTVKMNGRFWDENRDRPSANAARKEGKAPASRTPVPFPAQPQAQKGSEAWDRMIQLRGRADRETSREPGVVLDKSQEEEHVDSTFAQRPATRLFSAWQRGPVMRTFMMTGGAVAIGLLFGFIVLTVFSEKELSQSYRDVLGDTVQTLTAQSASEKSAANQQENVKDTAGKSASPTTGTNADVNVQLPEVKMFVAQAGVFQPNTSAEAATEPLDKLGIPHLLYKDSSKQYMFAAAAPTRDAVLGFAASLKNKGIDVYVKEFSVPTYQGSVAVNIAAPSDARPDLNAFLANGSKLAQTLSAQSGQVIASAQPALSEDEAAAMKEQHRQFLEESRLIQSQAGGTPYFSGMVSGINRAMDARDKMAEANAGKKAQSAESYAWQVQAGILEYLENYAAWVQQIQKTE